MGYASGICKKRFFKPAKAQTSFCAGLGSWGLRGDTAPRTLAGEAAQNLPPACPCLSPFFHSCLYLFSHLHAFLFHRSLWGTYDYPRCHPHTASIHCADLPTHPCTVISLDSTQPLTLIFAQALCPPPPDLTLLPCKPLKQLACPATGSVR